MIKGRTADKMATNDTKTKDNPGQEPKKIIQKDETFIIEFPPIKAPRWLQGFVDFIREQGVVGLTVGLVLGFGAKSLVDSLVLNIINPFVSLIGGVHNGELGTRYICLSQINGQCATKLGWGKVLSDTISFIIILSIVYFLIKGLKLDKLDKKKKD